MVKIICYDSAIHNLGIVMIEYINHHQIIKKLLSDMVSLARDLNRLMTLSNSLDDILNEINNLQTMHMLLNNYIDNSIKILFADVVELNINTDSSLEIRANAVKTLLYNISLYLPKPDIVLIEHQMKHNDITRQMSSQIGYYYSNAETDIKFKFTSLEVKKFNNNTTVIYVNPSSKNTISFTYDLAYQKFISLFNNYDANKKHTEANFIYFCKTFKLDQYLKYITIIDEKKIHKKIKNKNNNDINDNIKEKNINDLKDYLKLNDISDSFMLICAYIKNNT